MNRNDRSWSQSNPLKISVDFFLQSDTLLRYAASDLPAVNGLKAELSRFV